MASYLLHVGATLLCPHGSGQIQIAPGSARVCMGGQPVATLSDLFVVAGCGFTVPPNKPQPCVQVQWLMPANRVRAGGQPVLLQSSTGLCKSAEQIPQGSPNVVRTQMRVKGE